MRFSYSAIWDDAVRLLKSHASLLIAVASAFLFLPEMLVAYLLPAPEAKTWAEFVQVMTVYLETNWHWLLLGNVVGAVGSIAMLLLLIGRSGTSVGEAIGGSLPLLIPYLIAAFLSNLMIGSGFFVFILPGLYLIGRLAPVTPAIVAENLRNPIAALQRGFTLTRGRGWMVLGLIVLVFAAGWLVVFATSRVVGALLLLLAGQGIGGTLSLILDAALGAGLTTVMLVLYAAIYQHLRAAQPGQPRSNGI